MIYVISGGPDSNSLQDAYAIISVKYPAGSTCTCSNGTIFLTAGNDYGVWAFSIPVDGSWTITISRHGASVSKEIVITTKGQAEAITLEYDWYIFKEGVGLEKNIAVNFTGTLTYDSASIKLVSGGSATYSMVISPQIPDIHKYNTLQVKANVGNGYGTCEFGLCKSSDTTYAELRAGTGVILKYAPSAKNAIDTYNIDLTSISAAETSAYFYTLCPNGAHTTYFYNIVALP